MGRSRVHVTIDFLLSFISLRNLWPLRHQPRSKPKLTLDDFFNWVEIQRVKLSPDGNSVLIATERADWEQQIFRNELWLYRILPTNSDKSGTGNSGALYS